MPEEGEGEKKWKLIVFLDKREKRYNIGLILEFPKYFLSWSNSAAVKQLLLLHVVTLNLYQAGDCS